VRENYMMWISYDFSADIRLSEFGIGVPLDDERARDIILALKGKGTQIDFSSHAMEIEESDLARAHDKNYINLLKTDPAKAIQLAFELVDEHGNFHRYNPASAKHDLTVLYQRILRQASGLYLSAKKAVEDKNEAYFLGGGMHHAMSDGGRGFCLVNDIVIAIRKLQEQGLVKTAWVIDTDAHKGDGTAQITAGDDTIATLSIHMKNGWPLDQNAADPKFSKCFIPSKIDIPVGASEEEFYQERLQKGLLQLDRDFPNPDLCIVVAGSDPWEEDKLPSSALLKLEKADMLMRDKLVYEFLKARAIPQTWCFAGGYGKRAYEIPLQFLNLVL
jgi:acetoin utilization deacetylase AcuC-like enzyme